MRFPDLRRTAALACALAALAAHATPESSRSEVAARLQRQLPGVPPASYALGAAAFDEELRARVEEGSAAAEVLQAGKQLWERRFRNGKTLAGCFPNGGRRIAASYPLYDTRLKRVVTLELAINQCLKGHGEAPLEFDSSAMALVTAYLRSLANGQKAAVRVPAAGQASFDQGQRLYFTRMGQRNYACASCHVQSAGKRFGDTPLSPAIGQATHWPIVRDGVPVTLHTRIRECLELMGAAPFPAGSDELNQVEYFLAYLSNGLPLRANVWRPKAAS